MTTNHPGAGPGPSLRSLLAGAVAGNLRLANRLNALAWERVLGSSDAPRTGAPDLLATVLEAQLRSFSTAAAVLGELAAPFGSSRRVAAEAPPPAPVRLDVAGGRSATIPFAIENQYDHPVDVAFAADPLLAPGEPPVDVVSFEPEATTLPPGGRLVVRATIRVSDRLAVGRVYSTALRVRELPAAPLYVEVMVTP